MKKFLAVIKREYIARVRAKMFIVSTVLLPVALSLFGIVPAIIFSIQTPPLRVAVVDQTGKMFAELKRSLESDSSDQNTQSDNTNQIRGLPRTGLGAFKLEDVNATNQSLDDIRANLEQRMRVRDLDGYLILPPDFISTGKAEFFNRNPGDVVSLGALQSTLNRATREQRLIDAKVDNKTRRELFSPVNLEGVGVSGGSQSRDANASFALVFGVGFVMYLSILMYGQIILGAVIEEKETRIAEILFSSIKPFTLMMGKLVGVSFVALTQLAIWG